MIYVLQGKDITAAILRYVVEEHCAGQAGNYNADVRLICDAVSGEFTAEVENLKRIEE